MTTLGAIDYAASFFKYKTPTPIQGTPTNKTLKRLKQSFEPTRAVSNQILEEEIMDILDWS